MLSVICYGRNDGHGYNYPKRLALSLNGIAEVLTHPGDEIVFVDYNSPDDGPTAPESIQDTLTDRAKSLLRILRLRPHHHQAFAQKTKLPIIEPIARNSAIRRSNPQNKWILSTNSDMLFVPVSLSQSLTDIVADLPDGFYSLPRFELPEHLWEMALQRSDPMANMAFLRKYSRPLKLEYTVRRTGFLPFDNPGDFQLMLREDIHRMGGFDERMLHGWHVDSNLCKRISLLPRNMSSLEDQIKAFHCNHTLKESLLHTERSTENDWDYFVDGISSPHLWATDWGLVHERLEEIHLHSPNADEYVKPLLSLDDGMDVGRQELLISQKTYNGLLYSSSRVLTHICSHLRTIPKTADIAYIGYNRTLLQALSAYLEKSSHLGKLLCLEKGSDFAHNVEVSALSDLCSRSFLFIIDFGFERDTAEDLVDLRKKLKRLMRIFLQIVHKKNTIRPKTKFIGVNVLHTDIYPIFSWKLIVRAGTYVPGISYGYWMKSPPARATKKKIMGMLRYLAARHFFNHTDKVRSLWHLVTK